MGWEDNQQQFVNEMDQKSRQSFAFNDARSDRDIFQPKSHALPSNQIVTSPKQVMLSNVIQVRTNLYHTLALCDRKNNRNEWLSRVKQHEQARGSSNPTLYGWGKNTFGQLGLEGIQGSAIPLLVSDSIKFTRVSVGVNTSAGISTDGKLFVWGDADRLLLEQSNHLYHPKLHTFLNSQLDEIIDIVLGDKFNFVIGKNKTLYWKIVAENNSGSECEDAQIFYKEKHNLVELDFNKSEEKKLTKIKKPVLSVGAEHCCYISENRIYALGINDISCRVKQTHSKRIQ